MSFCEKKHKKKTCVISPHLNARDSHRDDNTPDMYQVRGQRGQGKERGYRGHSRGEDEPRLRRLRRSGLLRHVQEQGGR